MKTVGQILYGERNKKNISIEELSLATKIDAKYIKALEADRYDLLPSETFAKGFIRNLSLNLNCNPEENIAIFRRDYRDPNNKNFSKITNQSSKKIISKLSPQYRSIALGIVVFLIYLGFQFRVILTPPPLKINKPSNDSVLASPIEISGTTSSDSLVKVNEDSVIKPDQNGNFQLILSLPVGETKVKIKTTNRFGRSQSTEIPLTIISN